MHPFSTTRDRYHTHLHNGGEFRILHKKYSPNKHHTYPYTECIYTESPSVTVQRLKSEIKESAKKITKKGAIPCFCTITSCDIAKYNHNLLKQNQTTALYYTKDYSTMQTNLEKALEDINKYILEINRIHHMSTPYCHTAIRKRQGKPTRYYYKFCYDLLWDGVHGTTQT